ncbi:MAG: lasso peptide biosynthesis B2 protein, partial [Planctomycetes bacterium]|nr:lasso peptide biosynthesis B2 protein [Planctomycetota bacterium]
IKKIRENFGSFQDIWLFSRIFFLVNTLPVMLKFFSIPGLMELFTPRAFNVCKRSDIEEFKNKVMRFTDYVLSRKYVKSKNTCLRRSLILYYFLRKSGINVTICFGVRFNGMQPPGPAQKKLEGHAWLLYRGEIYLERNVEAIKTYKMTYSFPDVGNQILN